LKVIGMLRHASRQMLKEKVISKGINVRMCWAPTNL
jgi:hypothetical protein